LRGYVQLEVAPRQPAFVAGAEKALLDLCYLTPGPIDEAFVAELRLEGSAGLDAAKLERMAESLGKPKLIAAAAVIRRWLEAQGQEERSL
jgi:hypothetical protein